MVIITNPLQLVGVEGIRGCGIPNPKWGTQSTPLLLRHRGLGGRGCEKVPRAGTVNSIKERMLSRYGADASHLNSQQSHQHVRDLCESQRGVGLHIFESGHKIPPLAEKLLAFESFWRGGVLVTLLLP